MAIAATPKGQSGSATTGNNNSNNKNQSQVGRIAGKKRRLSESSTFPSVIPKRVSFRSAPTIFLVDKLANKYNKRKLWYNKLELARSRSREVQQNLKCLHLADAHPDSELTWRGLEDWQPEEACSHRHSYDSNRLEKAEDYCSGCRSRSSSREANCRSYTYLIVQEYLEQLWHTNTYDDHALAYLACAISEEDRNRALQRGLEDRQAALAATTEAASYEKCVSKLLEDNDERPLMMLWLANNVSIAVLQSILCENWVGPVACVFGGYVIWMLRAMF